MSRIEELFEIADTPNVVAVRVVYPDGGEKKYLTELGRKAPKSTAVLHGDKEEKVFLLFRYPELYCDEVRKFVHEKIRTDDEWRKRYWSDTTTVRRELRHAFRDALFEKAKEILNEKDDTLDKNTPTTKEEDITKDQPIEKSIEKDSIKPVYKSRTIIGSTIASCILVLLNKIGIHMTIEEVAAILTLLTWFFRAITKKAIA